MADFPPVHPGEILLTEFMEPIGLSQYRLAQAINVSPRRINEIVHGKRAITPDTAVRLSMALGTSDMFWVNLQARYEFEVARESIPAAAIARIDPASIRRVPKATPSPSKRVVKSRKFPMVASDPGLRRAVARKRTAADARKAADRKSPRRGRAL